MFSMKYSSESTTSLNGKNVRSFLGNIYNRSWSLLFDCNLSTSMGIEKEKLLENSKDAVYRVKNLSWNVCINFCFEEMHNRRLFKNL